jgi:hypothetical protein
MMRRGLLNNYYSFKNNRFGSVRSVQVQVLTRITLRRENADNMNSTGKRRQYR